MKDLVYNFKVSTQDSMLLNCFQCKAYVWYQLKLFVTLKHYVSVQKICMNIMEQVVWELLFKQVISLNYSTVTVRSMFRPKENLISLLTYYNLT